MLDEKKADDSLEKIMEMIDDMVLKAKTKEEKEKALEWAKEFHRINNDRLKIQNDRYVSEAKLALDAEKFDHDKEVQAEAIERENRMRTFDTIFRTAFQSFGAGAMVYGLYNQRRMINENVIDTNEISRATSRGVFGAFADLFRRKS